MPSSSEKIVASGRLRVVFDRRDDRWGHRVEWCTDQGHIVPLLESVEGVAGEQAVPSPPVQELQMQRCPNGVEVALGVGMAGRNHWSIAFTPRYAANHRPVDDWLAFGLACRLREKVPELRSSYRAIPSVQLAHVEPRTMEMVGPDLRIRVHSEEALVATAADAFAIVVSIPQSRTTPYTQHWSYGIGCEPRHG